jgi:hypothetical protein
MKTSEKIDTGCGAETLRTILKCVVTIVAIALSFSSADAGTIGYYRFESGPAGATGMTIVDSSGNNNDGTIFAGSAVYSSNVPVALIPQTGQANTMSLDLTTGDAAFFNYEFPFQTLTNATVELWINPSTASPSGDYDFFWTTTGSGDLNRFNFHFDPGPEQVCLDYREPNSTIHSLGCSGANSVPLNQWTYVAFVKQGNVYSIYLNNSVTGNVTNLTSQVTDSAPNLPNSTAWTLNGRAFVQPAFGQYAGLIDEIRLSDTALTADQFLISPLSVTINIKPPAQAPVALNLKAPTLPVAILSSPTFNATTQVNPATINLSGASVSTNNKGKFACGAQDVNGDGLPDLVCQVITSQLQLSSTSTMAMLTAETFSGQPLSGGEAITIVGH